MQSNIVLIALFLAVCIRNSESDMSYHDCVSDQSVVNILQLLSNELVPLLIINDSGNNPQKSSIEFPRFMKDNYKNAIVVHRIDNQCFHTDDIISRRGDGGKRLYPALYMTNAGQLVSDTTDIPIRVAQFNRKALDTFKKTVESYLPTQPTTSLLHKTISDRLKQDKTNQSNNQAEVQGNQMRPPVENLKGYPVGNQMGYQVRNQMGYQGGNQMGYQMGYQVGNQMGYQVGHPARYPVEMMPNMIHRGGPGPNSKNTMINQRGRYQSQYQGQSSGQYQGQYPTQYQGQSSGQPVYQKNTNSQNTMISQRGQYQGKYQSQYQGQYQGQSSGQSVYETNIQLATQPTQPIRPLVRNATRQPETLDLLRTLENRQSPENYSGGSPQTSTQTHGWDLNENNSKRRKLNESTSRSFRY